MIKNIKNKLTIYFAVVLMLATTACDFGSTNVNPAIPLDVSAQAIVPAAQAGLAFAVGGEMVRINGLFMQHFQGINAQQLDNYKYLVKAGDMDGVWRRTYHHSLNPLVTVLRKAENEGSLHTAAMAKILIAHGIGSLSDMFGDVPYTTAFQGLTEDNFFPGYNTQQDIYTIVHRLLDEAITAFEADDGDGIPLGGEDLMYGGDPEAWIKVAHSLKAKYYLHTSKVDSDAYINALAELSEGIASNAEDFQFLFGSGPNEANPQFQFSQDRGGNIKMDNTFVRLMLDLDDPRYSELVVPVLQKDDNEVVTDTVFSFDVGTFYSKINSPVIYMSYAEMKFIEAEAELMQNDDVTAAENALTEAITASLEKIVGTVDAAYVADNSDLDSFANNTERLEQIITQKYIALYSHGLETWTDFRRTGFPALTPVDGGNNTFNLNGEIPRRLPYPQTEIDLNNSNVPITSPNFQDRFWWDQE
ncbi:SusD/RagB family nutrient-binding outer membrane lipoprotein [Fulvivirga sp. M361]|uniref:SusD/RagB family nutrient-binding outer membrane lipoprotein n=1 Tax=Fulvivirga sp. M361 TaxID=2594266 RepID=UPI00117B5D9C|nr:SusD/RagB family nutrient-binding outer membrane lipoprotein [Fulvivirga sp. M361]TRX50941.1 SusD/RagB family nutrient-binding outer membrane lipoprotein [Fulvivirga sp. M361]